MPKKDFSSINTNRVFDTIAEATAEPDKDNSASDPAEAAGEKRHYKDRKTYTEEETQAAMMAGKTAGKKGMKQKRINLAFTPDNYEYVQTMARVRGENMTDFINYILRQSMESNADIYEQAKTFKNSL